MEGHEDSVTCMVIDGNFLITGSDDCTIRLFDLNHFTPTQVLGNHKGPIQDLIFLQPSGLLLSCSNDKSVIAWIYQKQQIFEMFTKKEEPRCMDYVAETGTLLIGTEDCSIVTHNIVDMMNYMDYGESFIGDFAQDMEEYGTEYSGASQ